MTIPGLVGVRSPRGSLKTAGSQVRSTEPESQAGRRWELDSFQSNPVLIIMKTVAQLSGFLTLSRPEPVPFLLRITQHLLRLSLSLPFRLPMASLGALPWVLVPAAKQAHH